MGYMRTRGIGSSWDEDKVVRQQMGQKRTKGSGSSWGKKGQGEQAAESIRKDERM